MFLYTSEHCYLTLKELRLCNENNARICSSFRVMGIMLIAKMMLEGDERERNVHNATNQKKKACLTSSLLMNVILLKVRQIQDKEMAKHDGG